jgi:hypothetical protein
MRPLTEAEREQSALGPAFPDITFEQLLADGPLANRVRSLNPLRYREIRQDYLYRSGQEKRPEGYYDGGAQ